MELWLVSLMNSTELKIKAKKKDLFKSEKKYLSVKKADDSESEIFINRQNIVWITKLSDQNS
jgi:hypothetical protein